MFLSNWKPIFASVLLLASCATTGQVPTWNGTAWASASQPAMPENIQVVLPLEIAVSSGWHKLEIISDGVANWLISIDNSTPRAVAWTLAPTDGISFGFWEKAGTNVAATLCVGPWMLFGIDPGKE